MRTEASVPAGLELWVDDTLTLVVAALVLDEPRGVEVAPVLEVVPLPADPSGLSACGSEGLEPHAATMNPAQTVTGTNTGRTLRAAISDLPRRVSGCIVPSRPARKAIPP
jgi:hypothetical protein